jgi:hypothetical protein
MSNFRESRMGDKKNQGIVTQITHYFKRYKETRREYREKYGSKKNKEKPQYGNTREPEKFQRNERAQRIERVNTVDKRKGNLKNLFNGMHSLNARERKVFLIRALLVAAGVLLIIGSIIFVNAKIREKKIAAIQSQIKAKEEEKELIRKDVEKTQLIIQADLIAKGYDYDKAITLIKSYSGYENEQVLMDAIVKYENEKAALTVYPDVTTIPHIFFHSLIADPAKAFDGEETSDGYNKVMTTIPEFNAIMQQMYDKGFVLVSIKDVAHKVTDENGVEKFVPGEILLPEGKKPFVLSIDDVSYYEYMAGDGFASRIVLEPSGRPTTEMDMEDGTTVTGDFDVVPCLETFIEAHPDFSYRGARGILALTGYNGVLGYRTDPSYEEQPSYAEDIEKAKTVAEGMKKWGWEFASHSYGHLDYGDISTERFQEDATKWENTVEPILGETDILIYPFGADIGNWGDYSGERFEYLKAKGFDYFCNVDSAPSWVQIRDNYVRQGRRNLDGDRMYKDMMDDNVDYLSDLFDVNTVFDKARPVPVP